MTDRATGTNKVAVSHKLWKEHGVDVDLRYQLCGHCNNGWEADVGSLVCLLEMTGSDESSDAPLD